MTKKRSSEILADENRKSFWEKVKSGKFSAESEIFFGNRGNVKQGGNASLPRGGGRPWQAKSATCVIVVVFLFHFPLLRNKINAELEILVKCRLDIWIAMNWSLGL